MLLLATATGPGFAAVGVASRLLDAAPAARNPLLVALTGVSEAVEGVMMTTSTRFDEVLPGVYGSR